MEKYHNVEVDLTDEEWYTLMKIAHQQDITLNQLVNSILQEVLLKSLPENNPTNNWQ